MRAGLATILSLALGIPSLTAGAVPDLRTVRPLFGLTVCADSVDANLYYYLPGEIVLETAPDGRPALHFLQMRYTGTSVSGDRGTVLHRSILSFRVRHEQPGGAELEAARHAIRAYGRPVDLRPLPIARLDAVLNYTPVGSEGEAATPQALPEGHFEAAPEDGETTSTTYWRERTYALGLDDVTSQLFWSALQQGQLVLSLGYAFYAEAIGSEAQVDVLKGSPELVQALQDQFAKRPNSEGTVHLVHAGALAIEIDYAKWPDLFVRADLNESVPPGYPVLEVRCYDFNNALRPDLWEKQVEFEAEGITGKPAVLLAVFESDQPDLYARYLRFPLPVRLDRPYRYRVTEVTLEGEERVGSWVERDSWSQMLDVSSPPKPGEAAGGIASAPGGDE